MPENPVTPPQMPRRGRKSEHPRMIGPWKIGRTIGKGAMGVVRIARHAKTGQYAAIKIMSKMQFIQSRRSSKNMEDDAERIMLALEREIVVMKLVDHPNIMHLYDVWETSGELYLILEYVEGGELFDYIIERGRLSELEALDYFQQLISAMDYCHRLNIAHRDLKPENILLDKEKILKVADFGMAGWQCGDNLLKTSCGSPHYAAPEVISNKPYDGAISDIWSCGVILFGMLAGRLPFDDEDICTLLEKVSVGKFNMPTDIDLRAQDLLRRMLEKDVAKRIKISDIRKHPWFTSQPPRTPPCDAPSLDEVSRPIKKASDIDVAIFGNLRTLWHGAPDEDIIEGLINDKRTWEKVVYTLLMKYRTKSYENYNEELERARSQRRTERRRKRAQLEEETKAKSSSPRDRPQTPPHIIARPDPPTPRRASRNKDKSPNVRPASLPPPPPGGQRILRPVGQRTPATNATPGTPGRSILSPSLLSPSTAANSPLPPTSPESPIWQVLDVAPPLDVPELHDERVQRYLQEIIDRLNAMQKQQPGILSPMSTHIATPVLDAPFNLEPLHTPGKVRPTSTTPEDDPDFTFVLVSQSDEEINDCGLGIVGGLGTSGKENDGRVLKKSSLRKKGDGNNRRALADRHVQILLPPPIERNPRRLSYDSYASHSPTYSLSEGSSFNVSPAPKVSWFTNLFKPRHETFRLMSLRDLNTTREECRRLLANAGVNFVLMDTEDPRVTVLRCHLDEVRDPAGIMAVVKAVKFRVEVRRLDARQVSETGYAISVDMILEKGSQSSFRLIYQRLRKDWDLDGAYEEHLHMDYSIPNPFATPDTGSGKKRRMTYPNAFLAGNEYK